MKITVNFRPRIITVEFNQQLCYRDYNNHSYLLVHSGENYNHYLTIVNGVIELQQISIESQVVSGLRTLWNYDICRAARIYNKCMQSPEAKEVLACILNGTDLHLVEKRKNKEKINMVSIYNICSRIRVPRFRCVKLLMKWQVEKDGKLWRWPKAQAAQIEDRLRSHFNGG